MPDTQRVKYPYVVQSLERLASHDLAAGERLPSFCLMAAQLCLTIATLNRAVSELTRRGILVTHVGSGTYVASHAVVLHSAAAPAAPAAGGFVDLRQCTPPTGPVQDLLGRALKELAGEPGLFGYEPLGGDAETRLAGAAWPRLRGLHIPPEAILATSGAHEGMLAALRAVTRLGDRVLCEALHYTGRVGWPPCCRSP